MSRFVILQHDHPNLHWDFLLEWGDHLRSWRLLGRPGPGLTVAAQAVADHRLLYLDYEGALSGGRGTVRRYDFGTFTWISTTETDIRVILEGQHLNGLAILTSDGWMFGP